MKKILISIILILLCSSCLSACRKEVTEESNRVSETEGSNGMDDSQVHVDLYIPVMEEYSEYLEYIVTTDLPEDFVYYEMLSQFGDFDLLICDRFVPNHRKYEYGFIDNSKREIYLLIQPTENIKKSNKNVIMTVNPNDMRMLSNEESGIYVKEGITYNYIKGRISSISWQVGEYTYKITEGNHFYDYPITAHTAVAKLLNLETAGEVVAATYPEDNIMK